MKITVIGTGYVGLVAGACLADMGNDVICVDNNIEKLNLLKEGIIPIYEPGLEDLVKSNVRDGRLRFSSDLKSAVEESLVCFIAVGTPQDEEGACDLSYVISVAKDIAKYINGYKVIVDKSTVPVGTAAKLTEIIKERTKHNFDVVSNPEFLKQGSAVDDFLYPERIIIGSDSEKATAIMQEIYEPFLRTANPIIIMDVKSAEMTKYTANSFLATKISFINQIANLCEKVGANAEMVRIGITSDTRIGKQFLFPGLGYGGSCFPKDVQALIKIARENNSDISILEAVHNTNVQQRLHFIKKIEKYFQNNLSNKTFAVWGLAFKPKTNDMRESPAITIINYLINQGANIKAFDPKATETAKNILPKKVIYAQNAYEACKDADALLLLTEWNEFRRPDFEKIKALLKKTVIFDGRNQYDADRLKEKGIAYFRMG